MHRDGIPITTPSLFPLLPPPLPSSLSPTPSPLPSSPSPTPSPSPPLPLPYPLPYTSPLPSSPSSPPPSGKFYQMSSFGESSAVKYSSQGQASHFMVYNKRQLSRTYPSGRRVDSSNYNPVDMWNSGCQIGGPHISLLIPHPSPLTPHPSLLVPHP